MLSWIGVHAREEWRQGERFGCGGVAGANDTGTKVGERMFEVGNPTKLFSGRCLSKRNRTEGAFLKLAGTPPSNSGAFPSNVRDGPQL